MYLSTGLGRRFSRHQTVTKGLTFRGLSLAVLRNRSRTRRRQQQIVKVYAGQAGVQATPHTFRHQAITWLTRHSGLADAELQLITGHARRETLAIYQHIALDGDLEKRYQDAMKDVDL